MRDCLGDRMKWYEHSSRIFLVKKVPVIIRIDGKAFHTFTRKMNRPFDERLIECMALTTRDLVKSISGCIYGYVQSDEISLFLCDYQTIKTEGWFRYNKSKIESIAASFATGFFNKYFQEKFIEPEWKNKIAFFDARAASYPKEEVANYFKWRQLDFERNSIQMLAQANFSHKQVQNISCNKLQDMLFLEKNINWNNLDVYKKRGIGVYRVKDGEKNKVFVDYNIPIFQYDYFNQFVYPVEEK